MVIILLYLYNMYYDILYTGRSAFVYIFCVKYIIYVNILKYIMSIL
jgi:hypothetical protein